MDYKKVIDDYGKLLSQAIELNKIINERIEEISKKYNIDLDLDTYFYPYEFNFDLCGYKLDSIITRVSHENNIARFYAETTQGNYRLAVPDKYFSISDKEIIKDIDKIIIQAIHEKLDDISRVKNNKDEKDYKTYLELKKRFEGK